MPASRRKRYKLPVFSRLTVAWLCFGAGCVGVYALTVARDHDENVRIALPVSTVERFAPPATQRSAVRRAPPARLAARDAIAASADDPGAIAINGNGGDDAPLATPPDTDAGATASEQMTIILRDTDDQRPAGDGAVQITSAPFPDAAPDETPVAASVEPLNLPPEDPDGEVVITIDGRRAAESQSTDTDQNLRDADTKPTRRARPAIALALPDRALQTRGAFGPIPTVAADGRRPAEFYARPFFAPFTNQTDSPRVAMIVGGLGLNRRLTERAIDELPPEVTLAFAPYAKDLAQWAARAREAGHEIMLETPMEHGSGDPAALGPAALLTGRAWRDNAQRLDWMMSRFEGYFGVTNYLGARFSGDRKALRPLIDRLQDAGLAYIDDTGEVRRHRLDRSPHVGGVDRLIAPTPSPGGLTGIGSIENDLTALESAARRNGLAMGKTYIYSSTIDELVAWAWSVEERGYLLSPASSILKERAKAL